jgi:hypothetical protein
LRWARRPPLLEANTGPVLSGAAIFHSSSSWTRLSEIGTSRLRGGPSLGDDGSPCLGLAIGGNSPTPFFSDLRHRAPTREKQCESKSV